MTKQEKQILKKIDARIITLQDMAEKTPNVALKTELENRIKEYVEIKKEFKGTTNELDINKLWTALLSLVEIGAIMAYEQRNIISTKALTFVTKGRV